MSTSKSFADESPFLQGESILRPPDPEPEYDSQRIERPFLTEELVLSSVQAGQETWTEHATTCIDKAEKPFFKSPLPEILWEAVSTDTQVPDDFEAGEEARDTESDAELDDAERIEEEDESDLEHDIEPFEDPPRWESEENGEEFYDLTSDDERELGEVQESPSHTSPRRIILAAGVEFPRYNKDPESCGKKGTCWTLSHNRSAPARNAKTGSHWRHKCLALAEYKLRKDPDLIVCLYDFDRATREVVTLNAKTRKAQTAITEQFLPLVDQDYRLYDNFSKNGTVFLKPVSKEPIPVKESPHRPYIGYFPSVSQTTLAAPGDVTLTEWHKQFATKKWRELGLSIDAVYEEIEDIGVKDPYTLQEFHSFGHASSSAHDTRSGTVFVNTLYFGQGKRHPLDMDARASVDFQPPGRNVTNFRMAFALGATSYVWGCNWDVPIFHLIRALNKITGKKRIMEEKTYELPWSGEKSAFEDLLKRLGCAGTKWKSDKPQKVEMTGTCVLSLFRLLLQDTYMQQLANASAHCVTGGLPGTSSDYDNKQHGGEPRLSHIPMDTWYFVPESGKKPQDLRSILRFYSRNFGIAFNRNGAEPNFGRGYALFCPELVP